MEAVFGIADAEELVYNPVAVVAVDVVSVDFVVDTVAAVVLASYKLKYAPKISLTMKCKPYHCSFSQT